MPPVAKPIIGNILGLWETLHGMVAEMGAESEHDGRAQR
jgi:hypothetical protein